MTKKQNHSVRDQNELGKSFNADVVSSSNNLNPDQNIAATGNTTHTGCLDKVRFGESVRSGPQSRDGAKAAIG